ncbi:MAG: hypothetical protein AB7S38_15450 [Vulcanimicrobiota bacterium]
MRLDGVVKAKLIRRDLAQVFYDASVTNPEKIVADFNKTGGRYQAALT